jgi:hypothetical protein
VRKIDAVALKLNRHAPKTPQFYFVGIKNIFLSLHRFQESYNAYSFFKPAMCADTQIIFPIRMAVDSKFGLIFDKREPRAESREPRAESREPRAV